MTDNQILLRPGPEQQRAIDAIVTSAMLPENLSTLYAVQLFNDFHCYFWTSMSHRFLAISVGLTRPPLLTYAVDLAQSFGFTGYVPSKLPPWTIGACCGRCCAIVQQPLVGDARIDEPSLRCPKLVIGDHPRLTNRA
jgi:hypothetical protein